MHRPLPSLLEAASQWGVAITTTAFISTNEESISEDGLAWTIEWHLSERILGAANTAPVNRHYREALAHP
jgi:hypothetical protein